MSEATFADGVLVIDKPDGPTSHDVVAVTRRALGGTHTGSAGRQKVGHTGTLDPLAAGVLPLVIGKATRLAQFLAATEKEYEADIELGASTDTFDRAGDVTAREPDRRVADLTAAMIESAAAAVRGTYLQQPPAYSAKKIDGDRAYDLARRSVPATLRAVEVTASIVAVRTWQGSRLRLRIVCSAGFYVRSLAHAIGQHLGTGAHLAGLVRTRSGDFTLADAVTLETLDRRPAEAAARVIPLRALLPSLPSVTLTPEGASLAARGGFIGPSHVSGRIQVPVAGRVRLLRPDGCLVAIAEPRSGGVAGLLHPSVVLE